VHRAAGHRDEEYEKFNRNSSILKMTSASLNRTWNSRCRSAGTHYFLFRFPSKTIRFHRSLSGCSKLFRGKEVWCVGRICGPLMDICFCACPTCMHGAFHAIHSLAAARESVRWLSFFPRFLRLRRRSPGAPVCPSISNKGINRFFDLRFLQTPPVDVLGSSVYDSLLDDCSF